MRPPILKPGMRFGNYTILKFHSKSDTRKLGMWESKCDCGNIVFKRTAAFTTEKQLSVNDVQIKRTLRLTLNQTSNLVKIKFVRILEMLQDVEV